jgi:hypothetical protein
MGVKEEERTTVLTRRQCDHQTASMKNERPISTVRTTVKSVIALAAAAATATTLILIAFAYPAVNQGPRELPVAFAGPATAAAQLQAQIGEVGDSSFELVAVADRTSAERLVLDREAYGALVIGPEGPVEVLTASAASPAVAQLLTGVAEALGDGATSVDAVDVTDVAPTPVDDPRGAGLAAGALPLTIGGILTGTLMALLVRGTRRQLLGVATAALLGGLATVTVLHGWLGALRGNVWAEGSAIAAGVAAIAVLLVGSHALFGRPGLVVVDLALVLVGNPLSGATSAPELLPSGWSTIGHWMPLGATVDLLRGISGFDGRGSLAPAIALSGWATLGLLLLGAAALRRRSAHASDEGDQQFTDDDEARTAQLAS